MSDEEESPSEGFSASEEDEWKPGKNTRDGESSDDDDSDFEQLPGAAVGAAAGHAAGAFASGRNSACAAKKKEQKSPSGIKGASVKKRKSSGQSLRSKLYNKYRPPPKTFPTSPTSQQQQNSPSASGSGRLTASKNAKTPNESNNADSSSESSVDDYLVNPADLDLRSNFFATNNKEKSPAPQFDCNAGIANMSNSGSGSEDNNESSLEDNAASNLAFDFRNLLENANSLERTREALLSKRNNATMETPPGASQVKNAATMDVNALLALGENQNYEQEQGQEQQEQQQEHKQRRRSTAAAATAAAQPPPLDAPSRLSKTKSTRIKRHTKTRPASTVVAGGDTDDSDFEEVADAQLSSENEDATPNVSGDLEIVVGAPTRHMTKEQKTQHELELALKRRLNRDIKDRQLLMHKVSLMCLIARSIKYNRLFSDTALMQASLKLLPSKNAYPTERGVELKYLQSFVTWFKTAIKLLGQDLYPKKSAKTKKGIVEELLAQIKRKEARCKQDLVAIFIILARGMGMNCRLIVNMQPMALRPQASDLIPIKLKPVERNKSQTTKVEADDEADDESDSKTKSKKSSKTAANKSKEAVKSSSSKAETKPKIQAKISPKATTDQQSSSKSNARSKSKAPSAAKNPSPGLASQEELDVRPSTSRSVQKAAETKAKPQLSRLKRAANVSETDVGKQPKLELKVEATPVARRTRKASADMDRGVKLPPANPTVATKIKTAKLSPANPGENQRAVRETRSKAPKVNFSPVFHNGNKATDEPSSKDAPIKKLKLSLQVEATPVARRTRKASAELETKERHVDKYPADKIGSPVQPKRISNNAKLKVNANSSDVEMANPTEQLLGVHNKGTNESNTRNAAPPKKAKVLPTVVKQAERQLRTRHQKTIPQLDGCDDSMPVPKKRLKLEKLQQSHSHGTDTEDIDSATPSPSRPIKKAPVLPKAVQHLRKDRDRRVLSTDDDETKEKRKTTASDLWVEVWTEAEEQWICIDLFKGKLHCVDTIRRNASSNLAYVFAFQDDLSMKDVTARYCSSWTTAVRKARVEKAWLDETIAPYLGRRTKRDITEDDQLRRIHSDKPLPKSISEFKDHPLYALERHLLKFQGIYPADAPTLGFIRGEAVYARDCVHTLHSRDIWLKSARVVRLGEQPYKIVKARPKWDRLTRTVIKDQPLEIFGYWQTQDFEPPTAENGLVPRNAYGNVELFKACMLPKKTVHLRLNGLMRVCKKLNIDCANAVIGFDFHQGACHPMYDGFIVCEEFEEIVTAAWEEDQQEQARKEREKYETRVYGNWRKLIKGLFIRERLKRKYNF